MGGTYVLCVTVPDSLEITVGALGERTFEAGTYAYVGSAQGTGGFARIDRHRELAAGTRAVRHWHIDYLLGHDEVSLAAVGRIPDAALECTLARRLPGEPIDAFGCSDCACESHLLRTSVPAVGEIIEAVDGVFDVET